MIIKKISICLLAIGIATVSLAETDAQAKANIQSGMDSYCSLYLRGKTTQASELLKQFFAPDCVMVDKRGKQLKFADWHKTIDAGMKQLAPITELRLSCTSFRSHGSLAEGTSTFHMKANTKDPSHPNTRLVIIVDSTSRDTYKKDATGHWIMTKSTTVTEKTVVNGREVG